MTGTSIDALDAALVEVRGSGLAMRASFVRGVSTSLGPLEPRLRDLADQKPTTAGEIAQLMHDFSALHARTIERLLGGERADLVCMHGQTVFHKPPASWQLMQPALIARAASCPVVCDLRAADLAAGGQGAPLTPIADLVLFGPLVPCAVVNLGGFCNVTVLARGAQEPGARENVSARDVCACNHVLDRVARKVLGCEFDGGGSRAMSGRANDAALAELTELLAAQSGTQRALGTGDEADAWLARWHARVSPPDLAATACVAVGSVVAQTVGDAPRVLLAGGGVKNAALRRAIESRCRGRVELTDAYGVPSEFREAIAFAVLGALCQDGVPISLPRVTGCAEPAPVSGAWVGLGTGD